MSSTPDATAPDVVGDVDGDGYADALVGSGARVELHRGGSGGMLYAVGALGDVNGDGYGDVFAQTWAHTANFVRRVLRHLELIDASEVAALLSPCATREPGARCGSSWKLIPSR